MSQRTMSQRTLSQRTISTQTASAQQPVRAHEPSWGALLVLLAGIFIATLDFFIVNVAIPATQRDLRAGPAAVQWIVAGFGLALAGGLIIGGRLGDLYGRRRLYMTGLTLFTAASAACALAPTVDALIAARVAQGAAAALLMPQVLGIINVVFTGAHRVRAFMAYGLAMGFAGVFGQLIGGALIQADLAGLGWRAIFWINVPIGGAAVLLAPRLVPEARAERRSRLDLLGAAWVTAALVAVVLPLVQGRQLGWPLWSWLCLGAAVPVLAGFVAYQLRVVRRGGAPLIDPGLFRERAFAGGAGVATVYWLAVGSFFLVLALYLQVGRGLSALDSGLVFSLLGAGYFAASLWAPKLAARLGRQVLAAGSLAQAAGYALLAAGVAHVGPGGSLGWVLPGLVLSGFGMGVVMAPMSAIVLAGVTPAHAGSAAGVLGTAQQVGGALGVAIVGVVFYGSLGVGAPAQVAHAFVMALIPLTAFCALAAALVQLLPRPAAQT